MGKLVRGVIASLLILAACVAASPVPAQSIEGDIERGKRLFAEQAEPRCGLCHTLKAANSTGEVGPNLDELRPDFEKIRKAVKGGVSAMPPYDETLSDADIEALAAYVANAVGTDK